MGPSTRTLSCLNTIASGEMSPCPPRSSPPPAGTRAAPRDVLALPPHAGGGDAPPPAAPPPPARRHAPRPRRHERVLRDSGRAARVVKLQDFQHFPGAGCIGARDGRQQIG